MEKYNCDIDNNYPYKIFVDYLKSADVYNFKKSDKFNFIVEHIDDNQIIYGKDMYNTIKQLNMISLETINNLIKKNDMYGNPVKFFINDEIDSCSPNSIKYIYFGLLNIRHILKNNLTNFNIIEIGGGYGGQCIILLELLKLFNIQINKYILIDLDEVVTFQKKYINLHNLEDYCEFLSFEDYKEYTFKNNNYLFSSYSLAVLMPNIKNNYYNNLFKYVSNGLIIWNNDIKKIDVPKEYVLDKIFKPVYGIKILF